MQRNVFKSHDRWQEYYSINKTSIRKNYSGVTEIDVTPEQSAKGYKWLMNLYKTPTGKERKNNPFGYREMNILDNYKGERFQFVGFYNDGNRWHDYYTPIYSLCGMEYYVNSEGIQIIG